jgi:3-isopropylmalate dehydrogenase
MKIAVLPGDGIGPEIVNEAVKVLNALDEKFELEHAPVGGAGYEASGHPLPDATLKLAKDADAILFGAVGDWKYDSLERALRPSRRSSGCASTSSCSRTSARRSAIRSSSMRRR